eukprot:jgi/Chrzof1/14715/Cz09g13060.t1
MYHKHDMLDKRLLGAFGDKAVEKAVRDVVPHAQGTAGASDASENWTIGSHPSQPSAVFLHFEESTVAPDGSVAVMSTKSSVDWTAADLEQVGALMGKRNHFVCMQLITMIKEQYSKVQEARSQADVGALAKARFMFMSCLTVGSDTCAAALFCPRAASKDNVYAPHVYVELICSNAPGNGYGSMLLKHLESFVRSNAAVLSSFQLVVAVLCTPASADHPDIIPLTQHDHILSYDDDSNGRDDGDVGSTPSQVVPTVLMTASSTAATLSVLSLAETQHRSIPQAAQSTASAQAAAQGASDLCSSIINGVPAVAVDILGIKLLSVESASAFYEKHGYCAADANREMFKPLSAIITTQHTSQAAAEPSINAASELACATACDLAKGPVEGSTAQNSQQETAAASAEGFMLSVLESLGQMMQL